MNNSSERLCQFAVLYAKILISIYQNYISRPRQPAVHRYLSAEWRPSELHSSIHVIRAHIREYLLTATSLKSHAKLSSRIHDDAAQLTGDIDDVERFLIIPLLHQFFRRLLRNQTTNNPGRSSRGTIP